jgi:hypothetical protein
VDLVPQIVLNMLHIATACHDERAGLVVVPVEDMLLTSFEDLAPTDVLQQCARQLRTSIDGEQAIGGEIFRQFVEHVELRAGRSSEVESRLASVHRIFEELLVLCLLRDAGPIAKARIQMTQPAIFDYVQWLITPRRRNQPMTIVIGKIPRGRSSLDISFDKNDIVLRKIDIRYTRSSRWPLLSVYHRAFSQIDGTSTNRRDWAQSAKQEYDLHFSGAGRISTRHVPLPHRIDLENISLQIEEHLDIELISTQIVSPEGSLLVDCTRFAGRASGE